MKARRRLDGGEWEKARHRLACIEGYQQHRFASWHDWGLLVSEHSPFFPSLILNSYTHLRPHRMSRGHVFANAHSTVVTGSTFYAADSVSGTVRRLLSKLTAWISDRSTSTTSTTSTMPIGRRPMGLFPLCQIQAISSQGVQKSLPNSRGIFPVEMAQLRRESSSYYMGWGVLERPRFA